MILVLTVMATIWGIGIVMKAPVRLRLALIAVVWLCVVIEHLVLPEGHPLRVATGGSAQVWLTLGLVAVLVLGYRAGVGRLRHRAAPVDQAERDTPFRPAELDRYARHIMLREIGGPGQRRLKDARVLVVGAGGLGSSALLYLAASGVGRIGIIDDDVVENSNLQRQVIHTDARIGMAKTLSAAEAIRALNPFVEVQTFTRRLTSEIAVDLFEAFDLVLDGSDSFETRLAVNAAAVATGTPLLSGAITQWEGQVGIYDPAHGGPCYACVFPTPPAPGTVPTCAEAGVAAPLPGVIGTLMALEAVKHLTGAGEGLRGRMVLFDGLHGETRTIALRKRPDCPVCGATERSGFTLPSAAQ